MKNFSDIQALLDRYWEGETTLEEERALKAYFNAGQVDERLRTVAPLFQVLQQEQLVQFTQPSKVVPLKPAIYSWKSMAAAASVALLLSAGAWWWAGRENTVQERIVHQTTPQPVVEQKKPAEPSVAVENDQPADAYKPHLLAKKTFKKRKKAIAVQPDPETEQAMEEIKAALALVSSKIRKGKQEAAKGAIHLETVDRVFKKKTEG